MPGSELTTVLRTSALSSPSSRADALPAHLRRRVLSTCGRDTCELDPEASPTPGRRIAEPTWAVRACTEPSRREDRLSAVKNEAARNPNPNPSPFI